MKNLITKIVRRIRAAYKNWYDTRFLTIPKFVNQD